MKYEKLIERLDFSEFEELFKLKRNKSKSKKSKKKSESLTQQHKRLSTAYYNLVNH